MQRKETGTSCMECGWPLQLKGVREGRGLICPSCGTEIVLHTFKIDERLYESMRKRALEEGVSVDQITAEAVEEYIEECDRETRLSRLNV